MQLARCKMSYHPFLRIRADSERQRDCRLKPPEVPLTTAVTTAWLATDSIGQFAVQAERHVTHETTGKQVGTDVGLQAFFTDSDGATGANPCYLRKAERQLKRLHRRVSRKQKRSKNRQNATKRLAKGYLQVRRQRKDFAAKAASALVNSSDFTPMKTCRLPIR
jgi:putative transposase